ncbi:hypothetical protein [Shewanella sp.]|uniref:hypothetical protein n=1 Tax=Shewanella sp. TaxID=50422 RepID=UPI003D0E478E
MKCDLCSFRPEGPACIDTCPTSAIVLVSDAELAQASARKRQLASLPNSGSWHGQSATGTVAATDEGQKL